MASAVRLGMDQPAGLRGRTNWGLSIGGISLRINCERNVDAMLCPSLQLFQAPVEYCDIEMTVKSVPELEQSSSQRLFDSGRTWSLWQGTCGFVFDFSDALFGEYPYKRLLIDRHFSSGILQVNQKAFRPYANRLSPLAYPLDELLIMHRLTQEKAIELHSCGIVREDGTGNLFVGHSGAGKSTTTKLWTALENVKVLSDDRIIVRRDEDRSEAETPRGVAGTTSEQQVLRLRDSSASRSNHFAQDDKEQKQIPPFSLRSSGRNDSGMRMYGTPWHGEAMYASPGTAPLSRIFILEHGHGNVITRLSPSQAVAELFARSFVPFHRHEYVDSALDFLQELVNAVPCYHYAFEPTEAAVEKIQKFRD
jgi:hypothetical protein